MTLPKMGAIGPKWMKIAHIVLVVFFLGGILSSFALTLGLELTNFDSVVATYRSMNIISDNVVRIGGMGTIVLGLVYGVFTRWGFFKHRWLTVKRCLFVVQNILGIGVVDRLLAANTALLQLRQRPVGVE